MQPSDNPFSQPYLTEGITTPSELLAHYSFQPLNYVHTEVAQPGNVFLLGRKGVGKTMILKLFDADLLSAIYRENGSYAHVKAHLPTSTVGLYINLASPLLRVKEFAGRRRTEDWWRSAFADYLNCVLLQLLIRNLGTLASISEWRHASKWELGEFSSNHDIASEIAVALADESSTFDHCQTLQSIESLIRARLRDWARFLNRENDEPPPFPLALGLPLFKFIEVIRKRHRPFRVMVLVDQYETLHSYRATLDLRPTFNQAMYESSRGGTGLEFKIGSRPYAFGDLTLSSRASSLETGREFVFVNLDRLAAKYFDKFVAELMAKRLQQTGARFESSDEPKEIARRYAPSFSPLEEAQRYVLHASAEPYRHLQPFLDKWQELGVLPEVSTTAFRDIPLTECNPLVASLTCIALTQWLRRDRRRPPLQLEPMDAEGLDVGVLLTAYGRLVRKAVEHRYAVGTAAARQSGRASRAADDLVSAYEQAALFRVASAHKNQRKYYAGFDCVTRISSNVALVFIQVMKTAWDLFALKEGSLASQPIPQEIQSEAIYAVSESWVSKIPREYEYGVTQERLIRSLGSALRRVQLQPAATIPAPNGFSVATHDIDAAGGDPRSDPSALVCELVGWGLLEESEHQDKTLGRPRRRKFYFNRVLCPYFGITEIRRKDPLYVKNLRAFVDALNRGDIPSEVAAVLLATRGQAVKPRQSSLF